jgi:hypothetical protein
MVWTHLVVAVDLQGNVMLFIDGVFQGKKNNEMNFVPTVLNRANMHIGKTSVSGHSNFHGVVKYVNTYPYALTKPEVQYLYQKHMLDPAISFNFMDLCSTANSLISQESKIEATRHGASCTTEGLTFDGVGDFLSLEPWSWGGNTGMSIELLVRLDESRASNPILSLGTNEADGDVISRVDVVAKYLDTYVAITGNSTGNLTTLRDTSHTFGSEGQWLRMFWRTMSRTKADSNEINWQVGRGNGPVNVANGNVLENAKYALRNRNFLGKSNDGSNFFKGTIGALRIWHRGLGYGKHGMDYAWPPSTLTAMLEDAANSLSLPCCS